MKEVAITLILTIGAVICWVGLIDLSTKSERLEACGKQGVTCTVITHVIEK